jgi:hypothetical protein
MDMLNEATVPMADEDIINILMTGEKDPYIIQDTLKQSGKFSPLERIQEKIKEFLQQEETKFATTREIEQRFNWISKCASGNNDQLHLQYKSMLKTIFYDELYKYANDDKEINLEAKKKAADIAVDRIIFNKNSQQEKTILPTVAGASMTGAPALLYHILTGKGDPLDFLPASLVGGLLGYSYSQLPPEMQFLSPKN